MITIRLNKERYIFGRIRGIFIFPFLFCIKGMSTGKINHEKIHEKQFIELFLVAFILLYPFGLWYLSYFAFYALYIAEYLIKRLIYGKRAYYNISFEREAYKYQDNNKFRFPFRWIIFIF